MAELTPYQRDILTRTALGEARGQGEDGMADVVQVILNRAKSGKFPSDPAAVALQNKQFSTWNKGAGGNNPQQFKESSKAYQTAAEVVDLVAAGLAPDMTGGALDYHASNISPYWADSKKTPYGTIQRNGHTFYAQHPVPPADVPSVASLLSVYREAPTPETMTPDLAQMRNTPRPLPSMPLARPRTPPSDLISRSMASLPSRNSSSLGDQIAMAPVQGGRQTPQPFDAAFDTRLGAMRLLSQPEAVSSQGLGMGASPAPRTLLPPVPHSTMGRTPQLPSASNFVPEARYIEPRILPTSPPQYAGPFVPQPQRPTPINVPGTPNGSIIANKPQDRLVPGVLPDTAVATLLDTRGMPALPRPRPNMGMGGVDILPAPPALPSVVASTLPIAMQGGAAPVPMPRLQRGGIFGKPQIFGHDIPLPGIFGVLQNATRAMNNSSGPFNNGGDNSLYNLLRGGDFNTPGAATGQAGGFLYAPKAGGGFLNVGRANPGMSGADTYAALNAKNHDNNAERSDYFRSVTDPMYNG